MKWLAAKTGNTDFVHGQQANSYYMNLYCLLMSCASGNKYKSKYEYKYKYIYITINININVFIFININISITKNIYIYIYVYLFNSSSIHLVEFLVLTGRSAK